MENINSSNKIYKFKEEMKCKFPNEIIRISEEFQKQYSALSQTDFCNIIGIDESSYRNLKRKNVKVGLKAKNMSFCFLIYMLDEKEHQVEDFCHYFEEEYHDEIKKIWMTQDLESRKKIILKNIKEQDKHNEDVKEKDDEGQKSETSVPPIINDITAFLQRHVVCDVEIRLSVFKHEKYVKYEGVYDQNDMLELEIFIPKIECIMVITHQQPDEEIRIMKENDDVDLFILIHNKKCQVSEYHFFDGGEKSQEIEDKLILECVDGESDQLYILNDSGGFCLDDFFNSEIKINKSENIANYESKYSELEGIFRDLEHYGISISDIK